MQQEFTILDNKVAQPMVFFKMVADGRMPVEVTLVVDVLNTSFANLGRETQEIAKFLRAEGGHLAQRTSLVVFTEKGLQVLGGGPTKDGNSLSEILANFDFTPRTIRRSHGFTVLKTVLVSINV